jgi:hypothetical protein
MSDQSRGSSDSTDLLIDEIVDGVYLTDLPTVRAATDRIGQKVDTVVSVCQESCEFEAAESLQFPIAETEVQAQRVGGEVSFERFTTAAKAVEKRLEIDCDILIHCYAGVNRSVGVLASALASYLDITPDEALRQIQNVRKKVNPSSTTRGWMVAYGAGLHANPEYREAVDRIIEVSDPTFANNGGGIYGYDVGGIDGSESVAKVKEELRKSRESVGESTE